MVENTGQKQGASGGSSVKRPIKRVLLIGGSALLLSLCVLLSVSSYLVFSSTLYAECDSKLDNVITYVENNTDADDLGRCVQTGKASAKYNELQRFLNGIVDDFELDYLYIVIPGEDVMINACSATSAAEFAAGETDMPLLEESDAYSPEMLERFRSYWDTDKINYFEEWSDYGGYYTGCKALRDSKGETVALICADIAIDALHKSVNDYLLGSVLLIVVVFGLFGAISYIWVRRNVTDPLFALEKSTHQFADASHGADDEFAQRYEAPEIKTNNEVQSLAEAIEKMANDMQEQAQATLAARLQATKAEEENRRLEEEARASARIAELTGSMASLLTNMPAITFSKDVETGQYRACNQQFAEYAEKDSPQDVVGLTDAEIFDEETATHFMDSDKVALSMDKPHIYFEDVLDAAGNSRQLQTTKLKFTDASGRLCLLGMSADVTETMSAKNEAARAQEVSRMYSRIAALSGNFICIYTVDPETGAFVEYSSEAEYARLGLPQRGFDFFAQSGEGNEWPIYPDDREMFVAEFDRERVLAEIKRNGLFELKFRLVDDPTPLYVSLRAALVEDEVGPQLIVGLSDIDDRVKREEEYASKLSEAHAKANVDVLTGVKNKRAYGDFEKVMNQRIENGLPVEFAVVVSDVNELKNVNDTRGHQAGDNLIKQACQIVCEVFKHSPVFRVGGDEFAVIVRGPDYKNVEDLMAQLEQVNVDNITNGGAVVACGMSKYEGDANVAAVFDRADHLMYENKKALKETWANGQATAPIVDAPEPEPIVDPDVCADETGED